MGWENDYLIQNEPPDDREINSTGEECEDPETGTNFKGAIMETQNPEVEYLMPDQVPEDETVEMVPLTFPAPLEQLKNLFDRMASIREQVIVWEKNTVITNSKTRDEAIRLRTTVTRTAKLIEDTYLGVTAPLRDGLKEARGYASNSQLALVGTKDNPTLGVAGRLTTKISDYASQCLREEQELKRKALAEQKRIEDEIAAKKAKAEAEENRIRLEEEQRIEEVRLKALEEANANAKPQEELAEGEIPNDDAEMAILNAMAEEQARIDELRVKREAERKAQEIADQKAKDEAQQKMVSELAKAKHKGQVKGVQEVWGIELIDETALDKKFMVFDPTKACAFLKAGFHNKKETDPEKIIPGLRCVVVLGKGGK